MGDLTVEVLQRPYFLGMARIIRKVLNVEQRSKKELISRNRRAMDVDRYCGKWSRKQIVHLKPQPLVDSKMSQEYFRDNDINGAGTESGGPSSVRCPVAQQRGPDRQAVTAEKSRWKWSTKTYVVVMECCFQSKPTDENGVLIRGCTQRMYKAWQERGIFPSTEQSITGQARVIRKNGWLVGWLVGWWIWNWKE